MLDSNTTLVKVKFRPASGLYFKHNHSNTTLVKVKYLAILKQNLIVGNSNTTLVKVKFKSNSVSTRLV